MAKHPNDTRPFHFRQFSMFHHRSTMKVGTDAVLLAVWADLSGVRSVLDAGSGSGVISLLLAARSEVEILAVEIDPDSVAESERNFRNSPFAGRLAVRQADFSSFATSSARRFDMVVSNPPFFVDYAFRPKEKQREKARHADSLTYGQLCEGVAKLLNPGGKFCLVLPHDVSGQFLETAAGHGLYRQKQLLICPKRQLPPNRVNLQLGFEKPVEVETENFYIREKDLTFTPQYIDFLKDFYTGLD